MRHTLKRYSKDGVKKFLGELETEIMEIVWSKDGTSVSVKDVYNILNKKRKVAYTTILTVMSRLYNKGTLKRIKEGRSYQYTASMEKDKFVGSMNTVVISGLFKDFSEPTLSHFVDTLESETPEVLERLYRLLEKRYKNSGN